MTTTIDYQTDQRGDIYRLIPILTERVGSITKGQTNSHHGYSFRGIDDIMAAIHPHLSELGITVQPQVREWEVRDGSNDRGKPWHMAIVHMRYGLTAESDGSTAYTEAVGMSVDYDDKAMNQAMSQAFKMAMLQLLVSPSGLPDPDSRSPHTEQAERPLSAEEIAQRVDNQVRQTIVDMVAGDKDKARDVYEQALAVMGERARTPDEAKAFTATALRIATGEVTE